MCLAARIGESNQTYAGAPAVTGRGKKDSNERTRIDQTSDGRARAAQKQSKVQGVQGEREKGRASEKRKTMTKFIYGIFDRAGQCIYVGQSGNPQLRWTVHREGRFKTIPCTMRLIRSCYVRDVNRLEVQIMRAYRLRGHALMNRKIAACGRPLMADEEKATEQIQIRVSRPQKAAYMAAAKRAGKTLTQWFVDIADKASGYDPNEE